MRQQPLGLTGSWLRGVFLGSEELFEQLVQVVTLPKGPPYVPKAVLLKEVG